MPTVLLVDRLEYLLQGMSDILRDHGIEVVGVVSNYEQILMSCGQLQPDILVMDPSDSLQGFNFSILQRIRDELPQINIIVFTAADSSDIINYVIGSLDVKGFVSKNDSRLTALIDGIRYVSEGNVYMDPKLQGQYVRERNQEDLDDLLSTTQLNVFVKVSEGKSKKEIADELDLTERYVGNIIQEVRKKLKAKNDVELVHEAIKKGLLEVRNKVIKSSKTGYAE